MEALGKLDKYTVLILDDIGYVKKSELETNVLFELIAHRYESGSLTDLPVANTINALKVKRKL